MRECPGMASNPSSDIVVGNQQQASESGSSGSFWVSPQTTHTYTLYVGQTLRSNPCGTIYASYGPPWQYNYGPSSVTVQVSLPPSASSFAAKPTALAYNGKTTLSWSSTNNSECRVLNSAGTTLYTTSYSSGGTQSSSWTTSALTTNQTYQLQCYPYSSGYGGWYGVSSVSVTVGSSISVTSPQNQSVTVGAPATVSYSLLGGTPTDNYYDVDGLKQGSIPNFNPSASSGSFSVSLPAGNHTLTVTAGNAGGSSTSSPVSITVINPQPTVTTDDASPVTSTTATLNGSADPNGSATTGWFHWSATNPGSCTNTFGSATPSTSLGSGSASVDFSQPLTGLTPTTTYYFCAIAQSSGDPAYGSVLSFTTTAPPPTVSLSTRATPIATTTSAIFNYIITDGPASSATYTLDGSASSPVPGFSSSGGALNLGPLLEGTHTVTMTATGPGGPSNTPRASVVVEPYVPGAIGPGGSGVFSATPARVQSGGNTLLTATLSNESACSIYDDPARTHVIYTSPATPAAISFNTQGAYGSTGITAQTTFTLVCTDLGGVQQPAQATVTLVPVFQEI